MERRLIRQYAADIDRLLARPPANPADALLALAELPLSIRGFGPVKMANAKAAAAERERLIAALDRVPAAPAMAAE
jgi:indolepyruvate ferredoxin oxidoreductase